MIFAVQGNKECEWLTQPSHTLSSLSTAYKFLKLSFCFLFQTLFSELAK